MVRTRVFLSGAAVAAALTTLGGQAQTDAARYEVLENVGLPAIDRGVIRDESHTPASAEAIRRAALLARFHTDGVSSSGAHYVRGQVIVKFRDGAPSSARQDALAAASGTASMAPRPSNANFDVVNIALDEDAEAAATRLASRPDVEYAQPAYRIHTLLVPNDTRYATLQWNLPVLNLETAWDIQPQAGSSVTVAVIDTGIAYQAATITANIPAFIDPDGVSHPALGNVTIPYAAADDLISAGRIVAPFDVVWNGTRPPLDFDGHGTHVSGTLGQLTNNARGTAGVAFNVKLMPVKVVASVWDELFGAPNQGTDGDVARGIRYAADNGAQVINMSIGRTGPPDTAPVVEDAIKYAVGKGVFIAIAGGNEFEEGNPKEVIAEIASRVQGAVSVAAVDRNVTVGDHKCAGTTASPSCHAYYSNTGTWIELSAPGGSERGFGADGVIWQQTFDFTQVETYFYPPYRAPRFDVFGTIGYIGTSMATPHVSGLAAMMYQQGITNPAAIEAAMEKFAIDLGAAGRDNTYGYGLIDARNSLRGLGIAR